MAMATAADVGASEWAGEEKTKDVVREKVAKATTHDPAEKAAADDRMQRARIEAVLAAAETRLEEQDGSAGRTAEEEDYEERAALQGRRAERAQAGAAREDGARGETEPESQSRLQLAVTGAGVEEVLMAALEKSGGALPFLQAAIDVAHCRSGLFCDPSAVRKVTAMAAAVSAKDGRTVEVQQLRNMANDSKSEAMVLAAEIEQAKASVSTAEIRCIAARKKNGVVVDKKQGTATEQVTELEAMNAELEAMRLGLEMSKLERDLKASRVSTCTVQSKKRTMELSFSKSNGENEVYIQELEALQSSEVDEKQIALVATYQSEIDHEKAEVKKLAEHFTAKELVELAQIFLAKSSELMSVSQGPNDRNFFSSGDDTSTVLGNLVSLARPGAGKEPELPSNSNYHIKEEPTSNEEQGDEEWLSSYYYSRSSNKLTGGELDQIFSLVSIQPGNPAFVVLLLKTHVGKKDIMLTIHHGFAAEHLEGRSHEIMLLRPNRKEKWCVKYYHNSYTRGFNCCHWVKFVRDNRLREGHICVFELMKGAKRTTMVVHVLRKVGGRLVLVA